MENNEEDVKLYTIFGECYNDEDLAEEDTDALLKEEQEALTLIRHINGWRTQYNNVNGSYGYYQMDGKPRLYFDLDNVWIIEDEDDPDSFDYYLDDTGDIIIAVYRYLRDDYNLHYLYYNCFLDNSNPDFIED